MGEKKISLELISADEQQALNLLMKGLQRTYAGRFKQAILYERKTRGDNSSDLDVLVVIKKMASRQTEIGKIRVITEPITPERDILITAIPVDEDELEKHRESTFFSKILQNGLVL